MAVTKIWKVKDRFDRLIDYAMNPEKTTSPIDKVLDYAADGNKTENCRYVSGVNCDPDSAKEQFRMTQELWHKTGGIVAFHAYQSFAPGEVDADTAHKIGVKLAEELWGSRFEVVVATHISGHAIHNHFCLNAVSLKDGGKYNDCKKTYQRMREVSDKLCREYSLSVIRNPNGKGKNYGEWLAEKEDRPTLRGSIREAIDVAIKGSLVPDQFVDAMIEMGFIIDQSGKHAKIKQVGTERFVRFDSLGEGYSIDEILKRVAYNNHIRYPDIPKQESPMRIFDDEPEKVRDMNYISLHRCYCRALTTTKERPYTNRRMYFLVRQDHSALRLYQDQLHVVTHYKLKSEDDVKACVLKIKEDIDSLTDTRRGFRNDLKRAERLDEPDRSRLTGKIRYYIEQCSRQLSQLRRDMTTCMEIMEHIDHMRANLMRIEEGRYEGDLVDETPTYIPPAVRQRQHPERER